MKELRSLPLVSTPDAAAAKACDSGGCKACGKVHVKLFGLHDDARLALRKNVGEAFAAVPLTHKIIEVSEPNALAAAGIATFPALMLDGQLMAQGRVPATAEIIDMLSERYLHRSKLHRLRRIGVAVDLIAGSDSALRYAWQIAQAVQAEVEVIYVMDSIFDGQTTSVSGFLSGYQHTMQQELDAFIRNTMAQFGLDYHPTGCGAPGQPQGLPGLRAKVVYGFAETALEEYSQRLDLLVLGSKGPGIPGKKWFGSVSTELSKRAHCPVLIVPPEAEFRGLSNILYASDYESSDKLQIQQAISFGRHFESQVHFVHVGSDREKDISFQRLQLESNYSATHAKQPFLFSKVVGGEVLDTLYDYALYHRIEMLVFVTRRRSFWENFLHRSVTREAIVRTEHLPVLIIHSDDDMVK